MVKIKIRPSALKSEEELQRAAEIATIAQFTGLLVSTPTFPLKTLKCTSIWSVGRGKGERNTQSAVQVCRVRCHGMNQFPL